MSIISSKGRWPIESLIYFNSRCRTLRELSTSSNTYEQTCKILRIYLRFIKLYYHITSNFIVLIFYHYLIKIIKLILWFVRDFGSLKSQVVKACAGEIEGVGEGACSSKFTSALVIKEAFIVENLSLLQDLLELSSNLNKMLSFWCYTIFVSTTT